MTGCEPDAFAEYLEWFAAGCDHMGSPFYGELIRRMSSDARSRGPVWQVLEPDASAEFNDAFALRVLGGVHRMVLAGNAPGLAAHYPSVGGDGDVDAVWPAFAELVEAMPAPVSDALTRPPQTNEVGRSGALAGGVAVVAQRFGLPIRLLEIGASAGLNLRMDRFWYQQGGRSWGDPQSAVRLIDLWAPRCPPWEAGPVVSERRGCDHDPIDATDPEAALTLLSYVWPGQNERFAMLRAALDIASTMPVDIDRADAPGWLEEQLREPTGGRATVVYHSVVWQYLSEETRAHLRAALAAAGGRATRVAPLAYLRLEPTPDTYFPACLTVTTWPGGDEQQLATSGFHGGPVTWPDGTD
ncbi:MAG TPA: DUF2332 domain-containing protein [Acidimicrobiia bacterium]|jgi:hypothetical protein